MLLTMSPEGQPALVVDLQEEQFLVLQITFTVSMLR